MPNTYDLSFIDQFNEEAKLAYQQTESLLSNVVRRHKATGATHTFQKLGKATVAQKARNGDIPVQDLTHTKVTATLGDWYSSTLIDSLDELKTNIDWRKEYLMTQKSAINRKLDSIIITAALSGTNTVTTTAGGWTYAKHLEAVTKLGLADVPAEDRYMVVTQYQLSEMMNEVKVISSDYTGGLEPITSGKIGNLMGFKVIVVADEVLPKVTGVRTVFYYNRQAVGLAVGLEPTSTIKEIAHKDAFQITAKLSVGAVLIDGLGVVEMPCTEV